MEHGVFISYSHHDKDIAHSLCTSLETKGVLCWIAPRDVIPGREWAESIVDAIDDSRVLVLVLSSNSNKSPQVIREIGRAASKDIPIIALLIEDVRLSKSMEYFISSHQWFDATTPPLEKHLQTLADTVQVLLANEDKSPQRAESEDIPVEIPHVRDASKGTNRRKRWIRPVMIVSIVVLIMSLAVVMIRIRSQPETIFVDDFESGKLTNWTEESFGGQATIREKDKNHFLDSEGALSWVGEDYWDYNNVRIDFVLLKGEVLIRFGQWEYEVDHTNVIEAYWIVLSLNEARMVKEVIRADKPGEDIELISTPVQIEPDDWYTLVVGYKQTELFLKLDGERVFSYKPAFPISNWVNRHLSMVK